MKQNKYNYSVFNEILIDKVGMSCYYIVVSRKGDREKKECMLSYDSKEGEFIMKVTVERDGWRDYKENAWGGARNTLDSIEKQSREIEAVEIIEEYMSEDVLGYIPSETEVNDFIWFELPNIMHLYDEE